MFSKFLFLPVGNIEWRKTYYFEILSRRPEILLIKSCSEPSRAHRAQKRGWAGSRNFHFFGQNQFSYLELLSWSRPSLPNEQMVKWLNGVSITPYFLQLIGSYTKIILFQPCLGILSVPGTWTKLLVWLSLSSLSGLLLGWLSHLCLRTSAAETLEFSSRSRIWMMISCAWGDTSSQ